MLRNQISLIHHMRMPPPFQSQRIPPFSASPPTPLDVQVTRGLTPCSMINSLAHRHELVHLNVDMLSLLRSAKRSERTGAITPPSLPIIIIFGCSLVATTQVIHPACTDLPENSSVFSGNFEVPITLTSNPSIHIHSATFSCPAIAQNRQMAVTWTPP